MKISKVDHRRTAVANLKNEEGVKGIIYNVPGKASSANEVVNGLVKRASKLYSPFNQANLDNYFQIEGTDGKGKKEKKPDKEKIKLAKQVIDSFKTFVQEGIKENYIHNNEKNVEVIDKPQKIRGINNVSENDKKEILDTLCVKPLKKTLRREVTFDKEKYYIPDLIKKLVLATCFEYDKEAIKEIGDENLYVLYSIIVEDRDKKKLMKKIEKSIDKQRVKISANNNSIELSMFSNDKHGLASEQKTTSKPKDINEFLISYASSNKEERNKLLIKMRKLMVLFVCGVENYIQIKDNDDLKEMTFDGYITSKDKLFIKENLEYFDLKPGKEKERVKNELKNEIRNQLIDHYQKAVKVVDYNKNDVYWLNHFQKAIETLFSKDRRIKEDHLTNEYLCKYLWKDFFGYVSGKYIDLGKGVYHFGLPNLFDIDCNKEINLLEISNERFKNGITSFDYERVKAKETLDRNIATSATFASSNFASSVVRDSERLGKGNNEDVLLYNFKEDDAKNRTKDEALRNIYRYFGGASNNNLDLEKYSLIESIKNSLYSIRNSSFHYTSKYVSRTSEGNPTLNLFNSEYDNVKNIYGSKYFSNNTLYFYKENDLYELMKFLYNKPVKRVAQIPSFNVVLKRKEINDVIDVFIKKDAANKLCENENDIEMFRSSFYFILKEIYYYSFLQNNDLIKKFDKVIKKWNKEVYDLRNANKELKKKRNESEDIKEKKELKEIIDKNDKIINPKSSFINRINYLMKNNPNISFNEICQYIMTDYNQQNQKSFKVKSSDKQKRDKKMGIKESYGHFPLSLQDAVKEMFIRYLNREEFRFLRNPDIYNKNRIQTVEIFNNNVPEIGIYANLKDKVLSNQTLLDWYVLAHFIDAKQLNFLIGDIRNYIQYIKDINKRASSTENSIDKNVKNEKYYYVHILSVLEFALLFVGKISNNIYDYFDSPDEYANYLSNYVDFKGNSFESLKDFCKNKIESEDGKLYVGLYCDAEHPILNKNIAYASMYGNHNLLSNCLKNSKINEYYINEFKSIKKELEESEVLKYNSCLTEDEQRSKVDYNNHKNRIELYTITTYTDIINDFMSQLISFSYLRERDLMYFQLGVAYLRLSSNKEQLSNSYRVLKYNNINIVDGALLYEIVSMYTNKLPFYITNENGDVSLPKDKKGKQTDGLGTAGAKVGWFVNEYGEETYERCLELFEILDNHEALVNLRNEIAHMKYMIKQDWSIMEYMSAMYKHFLVHDPKLRKSVTFIFNNILMKHNVVPKTLLEHEEGTGVNQNSNNKSKDYIKTNILKLIEDDDRNKGLVSDKFTYKLEKDENGKSQSVECNVRDDIFLRDLRTILEYKTN